MYNKHLIHNKINYTMYNYNLQPHFVLTKAAVTVLNIAK